MKPFILIGFVLLSLFVACIPVGKVTEYVKPPAGPNNPIGNYTVPDGKLALSPTTLVFDPTDTQKSITVTATDAFVHKDIYLCKTPCTSITDWTKIGEFDGIPVAATYIRGSTGLSKQLSLVRDLLNDGNNFIVIFTCQGVGLCNNNKWVLQRFTVQLETAPIPVTCGLKTSCSSGETEVLQLSGLENAHAALPGQKYAQKVCCNASGDTLTTTSGALLVALSDTTNAHLAAASETGFSTSALLNATKNNIRCTTMQQSCTAAGFDTCALSLSALTNAHAGTCGTYAYNVCCSTVNPTNPCVAKPEGFSCADGKICKSGKCVLSCLSDADCMLRSKSPCGCFNVNEQVIQNASLPCSYATGTRCVCDGVCVTRPPFG